MRVRRWSAMLVLLCAAAIMQPAQAQQPGLIKSATANDAASATGDTGPNKVTLNFVDADIDSVIAAVGDYTGTTFVLDPRIKGKVNLVSEKPLTKAQAFQLLTSVLRLNGYTIVAANGYAKVVPEADAKLQAGPFQSGSGQAGAVRGDQIATQVFHLNFESANNLVAVLRPLIAPNNTINANPGNNTLIITDYADNLLRLDKIIAALDSPASSELEVVPIRYAIASDIASMVTRLLEPGGAPGGDAGRISLLAESRSNSVIVRAPSAARANLAKSLIAKLDQPTAQPGNVHVVYLKNADSTKLAQTLRAVVASEVSATVSAPPGSPMSAGQPLPSGGPAGFIQADAATNTLIITANEAVYRNLRSIIDQLDARRAQVYIESLIVEVSATRAAEFGIQWGAASGDSTSKYRVGGVTGFGSGGDNLLNQAVAPTMPGNGLSVGVFRQNPATGAVGLGVLARALASDDDANILSMPNLITLDNEEAKIIVGQNVPFITGQYTTTASGGSAGVNPFQTIERKDIGLSLRVRPQISEGGTVKMAIYQESSSVSTDSGGTSGLITNKRSIDTNVLVDDGQIIVLGGLIDDNQRDNVVKVPGLGDIPFIGNLFKYQTRKRTRTNLMVFLRPTVIRSNEQSVNLSSDRYDYIRNAEIAGQPENKLTLPSLGAPQLPPLQDGRITGGSLVRQTEADRAKPRGPENTPLSQEPSPQAAPAQKATLPGE